MTAEEYFELGVLAAHRFRDDEATAFFRQVVKMDPYHVRAHYNLGVLAAARFDHAETVLRYQVLKGLERWSAAMVRNSMQCRN